MRPSHSTDSFIDSVILVDEHDHPIGTMDKYQAHRHGADGKQASLHRAVSVYLFRRVFDQNKSTQKWQLLLQQRSPKKIVGGEMWANTICGNVRPGESYRDCAYRRMRQELGISFSTVHACDLIPVYKFTYSVRCNEEFSEHEIDQVFVGVVPGLHYPNSLNNNLDFVLSSDKTYALQPNQEEVMQIQWVDFSELLNVCQEKNKEDAAYSKDMATCTQNILKKVPGSIAPWFAIMLQDLVLCRIIAQHLATYSNPPFLQNQP